MLSAFQPRDLVELKSRDKSKVESVSVYDDVLLVGLSTGTLRVYRLSQAKQTGSITSTSSGRQDASESGSGGRGTLSPPPGASTSKSRLRIDLMREVEKFSRYRIEQLVVVQEAGLLLALTNAQVQVHDLKSGDFKEYLNNGKGASCLTSTNLHTEGHGVEGSGGPAQQVTRVAIAIKRRILVWDWIDGKHSSIAKDVSVVSGIKSLTWISADKLAVGLASNYVLVEVNTGNITEIVGPGSIGGAPGQDGGRFSGAGVAGIGYLGMASPTPLATPLESGEALLAKDINTHFIATNGDPLGRRQIPWASAPDAIAYSRPYLLALYTAKGSLEVRNPRTLTLLQTISLPAPNRLYIPPPSLRWAFDDRSFLVSSERAIWRLKTLDYDNQIDDLVDRGQYDEAISLLDIVDSSQMTNKHTRWRDIKILKAQLLFDQQHYRDSIDLFTEVSAPPERVINLYPPFIAGNTAPEEDKACNHDDGRSSQGRERSSKRARKASSITSRQSDNGSIIKSPKSKASQRDDVISEMGDRKQLEGKALKLATEELRGFLVSARNKMKNFLNPDGTLKPESSKDAENLEVGGLLMKSSFDAASDQQTLLETARIIDTTLFRAYMFISPSFAGPLFRIDNFCDPEVVKEKLLEADRYNDLVDFYSGKKMHREALELLQRFGDTDKPSKEAPQLQGPDRTVMYLQNLSPQYVDLILQFAEWPLKRDPKLAMEVFLADTENAETLPRGKVLELLQRIDIKLAVRYLEHIIHELNDTTPVFHQKLVDIYVQRLKSGYFSNDEKRAKWTEKTLEFLRSSKNYQAYKILSQLDKDDPNLYEARAIVLSNMGQHKQALEIYVYKLKNPDKAEEYCNQVYMMETVQEKQPHVQKWSESKYDSDEDGSTNSIYHILLSLYLSPPPTHKPQWSPALDILAKHGARIPATSTLGLVPDTLPVKDLEAYFRGRIRAANTVVNEGRIVTGLRNVLAFSEEAKLRLGDGIPGGNGGQNRRVVITEDRVCGVCFKRFGGSAVKVLPDNSVVHYGCSVR